MTVSLTNHTEHVCTYICGKRVNVVCNIKLAYVQTWSLASSCENGSEPSGYTKIE